MKNHGICITDLPLIKVLDLARHAAGMTYQDIADKTGWKLSTIHRYFTDADYSPTPSRLADLSKAMGDGSRKLIMDWMCGRAGGRFVVDAPSECKGSLIENIARMRKEIADVISTEALAAMDGKYSREELADILSQCREAMRQISVAMDMIDRTRKCPIEVKE